MAQLLFFFVDGIGLGANDATNNPFAAAATPTLDRLAGGQRWLADAQAVSSDQASFRPVDATLGVEGLPQSATGQATILTGQNVPAHIGRHYGPKPTQPIRDVIDSHNVIKRLGDKGLRGGLLNAYPSGFFERYERGKLLLSSNQYALHSAGVPLLDGMAFYEGRAVSVDYTGAMWWKRVAANDAAWAIWRDKMGRDKPANLTPREAGHRLAELAQGYDFAFFDQWLTDYFGHRGTLEQGVDLITRTDEVFAGLLEACDLNETLIVLTSDHGNLEDIAARGHTSNAVPALAVGHDHAAFLDGVTQLTDFAPAIARWFGVEH